MGQPICVEHSGRDRARRGASRESTRPRFDTAFEALWREIEELARCQAAFERQRCRVRAAMHRVIRSGDAAGDEPEA